MGRGWEHKRAYRAGDGGMSGQGRHELEFSLGRREFNSCEWRMNTVACGIDVWRTLTLNHLTLLLAS